MELDSVAETARLIEGLTAFDDVETAHREATIEAQFLDDDESPFFLTRTRTTGPGQHTDVSLWFLLNATAADSFDWDDREFTSIRWWSPAEISSAPAEEFDPQLSRFLVKLESAAWHR